MVVDKPQQSSAVQYHSPHVAQTAGVFHQIFLVMVFPRAVSLEFQDGFFQGLAVETPKVALLVKLDT